MNGARYRNTFGAKEKCVCYKDSNDMRHDLIRSIFDLDFEVKVSSESQCDLTRSCRSSLESLGKNKHIDTLGFVLG